MRISLTILILVVLAMCASAVEKTLAEKLGFNATDKLLIVNADDAGMCHAANKAVIDGLQKGGLTSASIMVPCPWFKEIAEYANQHPEADFGVHLTHTSEWKYYKWGSVASKDKVPGLLDPQGYLWPDLRPVYEHAKPEETLIEGRAQIQKALAAGINVTHIDSHMGTLQLHPDYIQVYLQLAKEFDLPVRMASQSTLENVGFPQLRQLFAAEGVVFTDYFVYEELQDYNNNVKVFWINILKNLRPGVTELYIHPAIPNEELQAITNSWKQRGMEYETFVNDPDIKQLLISEGIKLIGYRPLFELQHAKPDSTKTP